jgi:2-polyprenyl-6-methoxyphenol hydroxylase-like FAD-dependent oxidoreductase
MRPTTSTANGSEPADLVIVGAGIAGSILALIAARAGMSVRVVDPNAPYPSDFRCEKFMGDQVAILEQLDLCHVFTPRGVTRADSADWLRHHGLRYDAMVNAVRRGWPLDVDFIQGRVAAIETGEDIQRVVLADDDVTPARLVVLATGPGPKLRESLGIERRPLRDRHSTCVGFSIAPRDGGAFTFQSLVRPGECAGDGMGFVSLFPLGETIRALGGAAQGHAELAGSVRRRRRGRPHRDPRHRPL